MATKFVITNTLSATEPVVDNAGAHTGPYAGAYKFNTIGVPVPLTNVQISLKPGESVTVEANDLREVAFFKAMNLPGITVEEVAAEDESEGGESSDNTGNTSGETSGETAGDTTGGEQSGGSGDTTGGDDNGEDTGDTTDDPANTEEPVGQ